MVAFSNLFVSLAAIGASLASPVAKRDSPDLILSGSKSTGLVKRQDYTQNYQTGGNVDFTATTNGYSLTYSNAADFVVGRGWKTGAARYDDAQKVTTVIV